MLKNQRAASIVEQYPETLFPQGSSPKKIVYQISPSKTLASNGSSTKQISIKAFNDMKLNANDSKLQPSLRNSSKLHNNTDPRVAEAQALLMEFDQEWKINDNIKRMRQSFNRRLNQSQQE